MKYLLFIWAEGLPAPEDLAVMQREIPGWIEEMDGRGVRLLGRDWISRRRRRRCACATARRW